MHAQGTSLGILFDDNVTGVAVSMKVGVLQTWVFRDWECMVGFML